ncbi:hypothetical protein TNIN_378471 [Trichonephila inaurata madagascariensis]|uniref:Uncharacterized protein n=1 Tax=Trichonephila inaurata madagascariensis TaxID=2747483 RepID=A0A8X6YRD1_9ARAC|nr:hypothetical protein TNIN_378471 [Trichonephila inaurata madagascariensis]
MGNALEIFCDVSEKKNYKPYVLERLPLKLFRSLPSMYSCHKTPHPIPLCLAVHGEGHCEMDMMLHSMPTMQSPEAYREPHTTFCSNH